MTKEKNVIERDVRKDLAEEAKADLLRAKYVVEKAFPYERDDAEVVFAVRDRMSSQLDFVDDDEVIQADAEMVKDIEAAKDLSMEIFGTSRSEIVLAVYDYMFQEEEGDE